MGEAAHDQTNDSTMTAQIDDLAKIIWDYHLLHHQLKKSDCILVLGSHDPRVAERGVDLFKKGHAPRIMFSGNRGVLTEGVFEKPEADAFADVARRRGVPEPSIIIERISRNTGENITSSRKVLEDRGLRLRSFIVVQKPYMERRTYATFKKLWPEPDIVVTSPQLSFDEYVNDDYPKDYVINIMVGDLQRIKIYPERGFQIYQEIPPEVWSAYQQLVAKGYTKHLI